MYAHDYNLQKKKRVTRLNQAPYGANGDRQKTLRKVGLGKALQKKKRGYITRNSPTEEEGVTRSNQAPYAARTETDENTAQKRAQKSAGCRQRAAAAQRATALQKKKRVTRSNQAPYGANGDR